MFLCYRNFSTSWRRISIFRLALLTDKPSSTYYKPPLPSATAQTNETNHELAILRWRSAFGHRECGPGGHLRPRREHLGPVNRVYAHFSPLWIVYYRLYVMQLNFEESSRHIFLNLWWVPNSYSKGFDSTTKAGSWRQPKRCTITCMWVPRLKTHTKVVGIVGIVMMHSHSKAKAFADWVWHSS